MALLYYSRMKIVLALRPRLLAAALTARVVSVYAAGMEAALFPDGLELREPGRWSFAAQRSHTVHLTTLFFEALARRHAGRLSLCHVYLRLVLTPAFDAPGLPAWWRVLRPVLRSLFRLVALSHAQSVCRQLER